MESLTLGRNEVERVLPLIHFRDEFSSVVVLARVLQVAGEVHNRPGGYR